ncbi:MAG: AmmeMemoRadiSam system protein B [Bacteroidales bacterium]|jgi:hypothetical protein
MRQKANHLSDRSPVVAGRFYSSSDIELKKELDELFETAQKHLIPDIRSDEEIRALLSPHAGYVFSGAVAASAFLPLKGKKNIRKIFLIGSSHNAWFEKASIYYSGHYLTPLGKVPVDHEIAASLLKDDKVFTYLPEAHSPEHSLEVQLPFLQYLLGNTFSIIPILMGAHSKDTPEKVAEKLEPYFRSGHLFVISTDLSHYPAYNDAIKVDKQTVNALCSNNPEAFMDQLRKNDESKIFNLSTSMCGWTSALALMYLTALRKNIRYIPVLYQNSGDIALYGERSRVVGYQSVLIMEKSGDDDFNLTDKEKQHLINMARASISDQLNLSAEKSEDNAITDRLKNPCGVFVSVYCNNELRGCIGRMKSTLPLHESVKELAVSSAFYDSRFRPLTKEEMPGVQIEISVLTPMKKITSIDEIIPGRHGILVRNQGRSGTYLPQVALKTGWNARQLVEHCTVEKAGMDDDEWKEAEIFTYEAIVFSDKTIE